MRLAPLALIACSSNPATSPIGSSGDPTKSASIERADDAIDRFIAAWDREVRPQIPGHKDPMIAQIDASMHERGARSRYSAEPKPCRDATRVMRQLIAETHYDFVLHGSMAEADRHDRCWAVQYSCCMKGDAGAALDAATGQLLVVWRVPEG